jgi:hypothetical protein
VEPQQSSPHQSQITPLHNLFKKKIQIKLSININLKIILFIKIKIKFNNTNLIIIIIIILATNGKNSIACYMLHLISLNGSITYTTLGWI